MLIIRARFVGMGDKLEEAAYDLGSGPVSTFRQVTFPRLMPAVIAAALLSFTFSFDDYVLPAFTNGTTNTWPIVLYSAVRFGITPAVNALATLMLLVTAVFVLLTVIVLRRSRVVDPSERRAAGWDRCSAWAEPCPRRGITRRRLLVAAGTVIAAPGCLGGSASDAAADRAPQRRRHACPGRCACWRRPARCPPMTGSASPQPTGVGVDVRTIAAGPEPDRAARVRVPRRRRARPPGRRRRARRRWACCASSTTTASPTSRLVDSDFLDLDYDRHNRWSAPGPLRRVRVRLPPRRRHRGAAPTGPPSSTSCRATRCRGSRSCPGPIEPVAGGARGARRGHLNTDDDSTLLRAQSLLLAARPARERVHRRRGGRLRARRARAGDGHERRLRPRPGSCRGGRPTPSSCCPTGRSEMWIDGWAVPLAGRHPLTAAGVDRPPALAARRPRGRGRSRACRRRSRPPARLAAARRCAAIRWPRSTRPS